MKTAEKLLIVCFLFEAVLCREFSISLPESVEAPRGLCVLIPCSFKIEELYDGDLQRDPTGIWFKDGIYLDSKRVFNSKASKDNKIEGEIIGDLSMKNCTTVFYNISESDRGVYYFRIETSGPLKYTYTSPSVSVRVRDSPISPSIRLYKEDQEEVEDQNEVVEGPSVRIICSAPSPPCLLKPPTFTWNFLPEERRQEQKHNTSFSSSQLNFKPTHLHHGQDFTCTATYWLQNKNISVQSSLTLHVLYGPRNTSVSASPSASVVLGSSVSLSCSSDANPAVLNYTWYRENGEQIGTGNHLTINTTDSTHSGLYYCRAQNQHGDHNSSVYLNVEYGPRNTSVSVSPSASVSLGSSVSLSCSSDANPAVLNYTWYRENGEQIGTGNHLTINTTDSTHSGLYYCRAQNQHEDHTSSVYLDVQYGPRNTSVSASPSASVVLGSSVSLSCSSDANPAVLNYTWYRENGEQIGTGNHLTINTTDSTHSGLYYCRAQNQHGDHNSSVYLDVLYAPQISPSSRCNTTKDLIMCFCEVYGNPSPKLKWHPSNQTALFSDDTYTQVESLGNMSLRRSIIFSIPQPVKDTPTLQCVGTNHLGIASQFFILTPKAQCLSEGSGVAMSSVLIGAAVGASVMMMLCGVVLCVRTMNPIGQRETIRLTLNDREEYGETVFANRAGLSESLHYATVVFPHGAGSRIRGVSSLTAEYATIYHGSEQETKGGTGGAALEEDQEKSQINMDSVMMQNSAEQEVMYGNITRQPEIKQTLDKVSEQLKQSSGAEYIYAQVKPRKHDHK